MQDTPEQHKTEDTSNAKVTYLFATIGALTKCGGRITNATPATAEEVTA